LGLLVAAPLTVSALVFLKMRYVEDALGDETVQGKGEPGRGDVQAPRHRATADSSDSRSNK
jgi:hypothetical protein